MSTTQVLAEPPATLATSSSQQPLKLDGTDDAFGDWRDDLMRDGCAVIKGAIARERADKYADAMYGWLESFNLGFDRSDLSTVHKDKLPAITEKGMCLHYAVTHEDFAWAIRSEDGVIDAFEKIHGTKELLVSFDAVNFGFPNRMDLPPNKPWPHQDQDPAKPDFRCMQGLVNLLPNGPDDGGLIVCKGGHLLSREFHEAMKDEERIPAWTSEWYGFTDAGMKWLADHGCTWEKICVEPGDLIVWDSRTPHYNLSSKTKQPRFCLYTCYQPVAGASQEDLQKKKHAYENWLGTTHWAVTRHVGSNVGKRNGEDDLHNRFEPINKPQLSERAYKLTGIPYISA